jgi:hypothetical protein
MKFAPFDYQAPSTLREAIDLLAPNPEAFVIAGVQSLMPVLAFRLATSSLLVVLRRLPGLGNIAVGDDGFVREPHPAHTGRCGESTRPRCSPRYQRFESAFLQQ